MGRRSAEIAFALLTAAFGAFITLAARELDTGWGSSGPEAGYFPLRVGLMIVAASVLVLAREALRSGPTETFLDARAASGIAAFGLPVVALIGATPWIGLYCAMAIYLAIAVGLIGRVGWVTTAVTAATVPCGAYVLFEMIFMTPLPKGLFVTLLGLQ